MLFLAIGTAISLWFAFLGYDYFTSPGRKPVLGEVCWWLSGFTFGFTVAVVLFEIFDRIMSAGVLP
jgi:hypothetical protein